MKGNESLARATQEEDYEPEPIGEGRLASIEPVRTPPYTPEEKARIEAILAKARANDNEAEAANDNMVLAHESETAHEASSGHESGHHEAASDSHGHETAQAAGGSTSGGDHEGGDDHGGGGGHGDGGHHDGGDSHAEGHGHHHENPWIKWGLKQPLAILSYLGSLIWQGLMRWKEMAGKGGGGGGHAKKDDHGGHGGGGHH